MARPDEEISVVVVHLQPVVMWLLQKTGDYVFGKAIEQIFTQLGFFKSSGSVTSLTAQRALFEQYLGQLRDRLDEDRLATLYSGFSLLSEVRYRVQKQATLENALAVFHNVTGLPQEGTTHGMPNGQLRALAFLGISAAHMELGESQELVAMNIVHAFLADRATIEPLLGEEFSRRIIEGLTAAKVPLPPLTPINQLPLKQPTQSDLRSSAPPTAPASRKLTRDQIVLAIKNKSTTRLDLSGQDFSGLNLASVDFRPTVLRNVNFRQADLSHARFGGGFWTEEPDMRGADLTQANLTGANLHKAILRRANFTNAILRKADLSNADLRAAVLTGADLLEANLKSVKCHKSFAWSDGDVPAAEIQDANLQGAHLRGNVLMQGVNLRGANLSKALLMGANLEDANLSTARLTQSELINVKLKDAILQQADLSGADMRGADLRGANLIGTNLGGANLKGAIYNAGTQWPSGFVPLVAGLVLQNQ